MNHSLDPDGMADENRENHHDNGFGESFDESFDGPMLRRLLRDAVRDLEPQPQALNRLRQAIPARRARRRQAMAGAAASVLIVGVAVPALVHAANGGGEDAANTATASASQTIGTGHDGQGGNVVGGDSGASAGALGANGGTNSAPGGGMPSASASGASPSSAPSGTLAAVPPMCARAQLGDGSALVGAPDSQGRVYGSFTVLNTSNMSCTVTNGGQITVMGEGGTDTSKIQVVDHTAGDPAAGLPASATLPLIVGPGKGYKVQFAWVPTAGGTTGCSTDTGGGTTAGGSGGSTSSGGATGTSGTTAGSTTSGSGTSSTSSTSQGAPSDAGSPSATTAADGISLSDVPQQGGPAVATASISDACAGTVYRSEPVPVTP